MMEMNKLFASDLTMMSSDSLAMAKAPPSATPEPSISISSDSEFERIGKRPKHSIHALQARAFLESDCVEVDDETISDILDGLDLNGFTISDEEGEIDEVDSVIPDLGLEESLSSLPAFSSGSDEYPDEGQLAINF